MPAAPPVGEQPQPPPSQHRLTKQATRELRRRNLGAEGSAMLAEALQGDLGLRSLQLRGRSEGLPSEDRHARQRSSRAGVGLQLSIVRLEMLHTSTSALCSSWTGTSLVHLLLN